MTFGLGGWGSRRKPMALVRELVRSGKKDLTIVSYGGPDVGILCATGQAKKIIYGFVSLDSIPLEPHFRNARQEGRIEAFELDEGMFQLGLRAAAQRLPFLPTRAGLASDVLKNAPWLRTVKSPYEDGQELVAVPALQLDMAFIHMHRGDAQGNGICLSDDFYFDQLFCMAADKAFMSVEKIVPSEKLSEQGCLHQMLINRMMITGIVEAPRGAHFTECTPDYPRDEAFQKEYAASAADEKAWHAFRQKYLDVSEAEYQKAVQR
jgi:glutaconate CoA-transferase subunit A